MKKRKISLFANPKYYIVVSIASLVIGIILWLTKFYPTSYTLGVIVFFPFFYWAKINLRKNIDCYAKFYTMSLQERQASKDFMRTNWNVVFPLFIPLIILFILIFIMKVHFVIALLGGILWYFLWVPEYKTIYSKAKEILSNK